MDSYPLQDDIGHSVLEIVKIVPKGVLCFFPSYGMMEKLISRWRSTGIYNKIASVKAIFSGAFAFSSCSSSFCIIRRSSHGTETKENFEHTIAEFYRAAQGAGAIFFAVCRGKVSEGLDFADDNARAVLIIGIPFPAAYGFLSSSTASLRDLPDD